MYKRIGKLMGKDYVGQVPKKHIDFIGKIYKIWRFVIKCTNLFIMCVINHCLSRAKTIFKLNSNYG